MAAPNEQECVNLLSNMMSELKWKRATMSDPYFRELMGRSRIEKSFLAKFNKLAEAHRRPFAVVKINAEYVAVRANQRHFKNDLEDYVDKDD